MSRAVAGGPGALQGARPFAHSRAARGFTLVELLIVITMIGILSAIAVSRFAGRQPYAELGYAEDVAAATRYAQKLAIATGCPVRISFPDAASFRLRRTSDLSAAQCGAPNFNADVVDPSTGQTPYAVSAPSDVAVSTAGGFPVSLDFDAQGRVSPDADRSIKIGPRTLLVRRDGGQAILQ